MGQQPKNRLALPLDVSTLTEARAWVERLAEHVGVFKVGLELFTAAGPDAVRMVHDAGAQCFLDLKLHDIPATVARATQAAAALKVEFLTVHASAGSEALRAASEVCGATRLLAITVLTSEDAASLAAQGIHADAATLVAQRASLAWEAGVRGLVCSALECAALRAQLGAEAFLVTPGIRLGGASHDQKRVATPRAAIESGADLLVVGRPIRDATNPIAVAQSIVAAIDAASGP